MQGPIRGHVTDCAQEQNRWDEQGIYFSRSIHSFTLIVSINFITL